MKTFACNGEWRGRKITASVLVLDQGIRVDLYGALGSFIQFAGGVK